MTAGVGLVRVRKGRGRVHLTAAVQAGRPVQTLCGKALASVEVTELDADCSLCVRRQHDSALVSSALFNQDRGEDLLQASLDAARRRREGRPDLRVVQPPPGARAPERPRRAPREEAAPAVAPRRGELEAAGLRPFSEDVFVSPGGGIVRMDGERVAEITAGTAQLVRTPEGMRLKLGDLRVTIANGEVDVRLERGQ